MTSPASRAEKEFLKGDCNTLNSFFQLYNVYSSSQKYHKRHSIKVIIEAGK